MQTNKTQKILGLIDTIIPIGEIPDFFTCLGTFQRNNTFDDWQEVVPTIESMWVPTLRPETNHK